MDEYVLTTVIALDETETLLIIEPLHFARGHASDSLKKPDPETKKPCVPGPSTQGFQILWSYYCEQHLKIA
jgi:hypothetical protein